MKKMLGIFLLVIMLLCMAGCNDKKADDVENDSNKNQDVKVEDKDKKDNTKINKIGNSINNIQNDGYIASEGDFIYYAKVDGKTIYKSDLKSTKGTKVYEAEGRVQNLNVLGNHIYFIENVEAVLSLIKITVDGKERQVLANDIQGDAYVTDEAIYYAKEYSMNNNSIMKMDLDGNNKETVLSDLDYYFFILDGDNIYYDSKEGNYVYNLKTKKTKTSKVQAYNAIIVNGRIFQIHDYRTSAWDTPIDHFYITEVVGDNEKKLENTVRASEFGIINDKIYYTKGRSDEKSIHVCNLDGTEDTVLVEYDAAYMYYDVGNNYIYYFDNNYELKSINKLLKETIEDGNNIHDRIFR